MTAPEGPHVCGDAGGVLVGTGEPCRTVTLAGQRCIWHPEMTPEAAAGVRQAFAQRGGIATRKRHTPILPATVPYPVLDNPSGVRALLADTIQAARTGKLDRRIAMVVINGATAAIKLAELEVAAQIGELERRFGLKS